MKKIMVQAVIAIFVFVSFATSGQAQVFKDVQTGSTVEAALTVLNEAGIVTANSKEEFRLSDALTRYEMAEFLVYALQLDIQSNSVSTYEDISIDDKRLAVIEAVTSANIMTGSGGKFNPDTKMTRSQAVKVLVKAFKLSGKSELGYSDISKKHSLYKDIQALLANQIIFPESKVRFKPNALMKRGDFVTYLARIIEPTLRLTAPEVENEPEPTQEPTPASEPTPKPNPVQNSCVKETNTKRYVIDVAVTNLWNKYNQAREIDYPSTKNPVEMQKWISSLSLTQKKWLVGKTDTQALYGDEVSLLETKGKWQRIAAKDQYVPYLKAGYPGWVPATHVVATTKNYDDCAIAVVTAKKANLLNTDGTKFLEISYATILPVMKTDDKYYHVDTPSNGRKLLKKADVKSYQNYSDIPKPTASTIINEAKRYLDLPYLWAGTSSWGYDCSGILYGVFRTHGIMIPRDSFYQATGGKAVAKKDLKPGDLVFFAYNGGKGKVYHVGLYIGDGKMLHAPHYASKVKIESMNQGVYKKNYSGARRYL